jgi:dephospho-CoA kinase
MKRKNKFMEEQLISFDGMSGAGKSTAMEYIADALDITGIHGDDIMIDAAEDLPAEMYNLFGIKKQSNESSIDYLNRVCFLSPDVKLRQNFFNCVRQYVGNEILDIVNTLHRGVIPQKHKSALYNLKKGGHLYTVEWVAINRIEEIWCKRSICNIKVIAEKKNREGRFLKRKFLSDLIQDFSIQQVRDDVYGSLIEDTNEPYLIVKNNGSMEELKASINKIALKLKGNDDIKDIYRCGE